METPIGVLQVYVNDIESDFIIEELPKSTDVFNVNGRYKISVILNKIYSNITLRLTIKKKENIFLTHFEETGEKYYSIALFNDYIRICIGVEDDIYGCHCSNEQGDLIISINKNYCFDSIDFGVSWSNINKNNNDCDYYTWYASDPTLF